MRVLFITHYSKMYGANKSLLQLVIELRNLYKIEPILLLPKLGEMTKKLDENDIKYIIIPYYKWVYHKTKFKTFEIYLYKILNSFYYPRIIKRIEKEKINLIHSNSSVINIGGELSKKLNIFHVWHIREYGEEDYNLLFNLGYIEAGKYIDENSSKVIAISKSIKNKYSQYIPSRKIEMIYNGIKIDCDNNKIFNTNKKIEFVLVGVLHENKNQLEALKAIKILKTEMSTNNFVLNILGDGKGYKKDILKYIKDNSLEENIKIWGYVENVSRILSDMDVGLLTSKKEAFGRVTVEMMLKSLPIIGTNTGATPELINKTCGFLYESGDIKALAKYMKIFIENREQLKEMGINSQKKALSDFSSEKNSKKIYTLYKNILKGE